MVRPLSKNFKQRITVSTVGTVFLLGALYLSAFGLFKVLFSLLVAAIVCIALGEFYNMAESRGYQPLTKLGLLSGLTYIMMVFASTQSIYFVNASLYVSGITLILAFLYFFYRGSNPFINLSITFFGLLYLVFPLAYMLKINFFFKEGGPEDGRFWLLYAVIITKMTDIGAYFSGKTLGKHKMTPFISPSKTWEGAAGGLLASVLASIIMSLYVPLNLSFSQSLMMGVIINLLAQFGDLAESLIKRDLGVKDSSHLPGLGGLLDILDSLVFTIPFVYFYLSITHTPF